MSNETAPGRGPVLADGFACARIDVSVVPATLPVVVAATNRLKADLKGGSHDLLEPFPGRLLDWFRALSGVRQAEVQPPISAILVPIHLIRRHSERPVIFSGALGTGPVARFVAGMMAAEGIDCRWAINPASDSPIEVGIRAAGGGRRDACVRLYLPSKLKHRYAPPAADLRAAGAFVLSVFNQGRARAAQAVRAQGGLATLRVGELGRHIRPADYLRILPTFHHVVISTRGHSLRQVAREAGHVAPRGWPRRFDLLGRRLAEDLSQRDGERLVVLHYHEAQEAAFVLPGREPVVVRAPGRFADGVSRASRLHGACASLMLGNRFAAGGDGYLPSPQQMPAFADFATQLAYWGTDQLPWRTPEPDFAPAGSWLV
jgi:hypothetical protein